MANSKSPLQSWLLSLGIAIAILLNCSSLNAQPVLGASNMALGGGGTAYLTGVEATFWNPANIAIYSRRENLHIALGHAGLIYEPVLSAEEADKQYYGFTDVYHPYSRENVQISQDQRNAILANNYPDNAFVSQHQSRADLILGGALWKRGDEAYSIVARARFGSRVEVGRGWYSNQYVDSENKQILDYSLVHQRNKLYELSLGYGRSFTFINGLMANLNKLYVGIAPKFVLAGPSLDFRYNARHLRYPESMKEVITQNFSYQSTGDFSRATTEYRRGASPHRALQNNFDRQLGLDHTGYGLGMDFGLTYVIPLGSDLSTIYKTPPEAISKKVIQIALSINDIGMVRYSNNPLHLSMERDSSSANDSPLVSNEMYIGSEGQYLPFFNDRPRLDNPLKTRSSSTDNYTSLLPTSINAGVLVQYSQLKLMGDLTLGLHKTAFTSKKLALHLGLEARPIKPIPLRFGIKMAAGLPTQFGIGTGIESRYWDFNIGARFLIHSQTLTSEVAGGAFAGIQLHL